MDESKESPLILLTGSTGYVGGRLLKALEKGDHRIRCLARRPEYMKSRVQSPTEIARGDVLDPSSLFQPLEGVEIAYYLIHSMGSGRSFEEEDRRAAENFAGAAKRAGLRRIIYLGGLSEREEGLSPHLRSRHEVGDILRSSGVQVIEFRASIVIGSGSLSFEMIRALTERLPVMITPRWVTVPAQPIAITDLIDYLTCAMDVTLDGNPVIEIGGADIVSYEDLMREYARQRGLRRLIIRVPVLTPRLSSLWLGLVTPLYARVGRKLIDSIRHPTVIKNPPDSRLFPIVPKGIKEAVASALRKDDHEIALTRWSDALSAGGMDNPKGGLRFGNRIVEHRRASTRMPPQSAFKPIRRIGGRTGWYYGNWLWRLRGFMDLLVGGVGMRRGRRDPENLAVGDVVDWWRVEAFEENRRVRFAAEMKLPGRAWLELEVEKVDEGSLIRQTAIFDPLGLWGILYWYLLLPVHRIIFAGMIRALVRACEREDPPSPSAIAGGPS